MNGTHALLVNPDDVTLLGENKITIKKITETLLGASKDAGLEINAEKNKHTRCDQNILGLPARRHYKSQEFLWQMIVEYNLPNRLSLLSEQHEAPLSSDAPM